ncbi:MAG: exodeoxyribonuclease VII small subunit [Clostridia bacterium]|nr:exodeoxyribonuclease VII small subunit [Clostridia bacterium]
MSEQLTFEQAMARLEQIVATLESGRCTLDDSLRLFEEGAKLTTFCQTALKTAEQKIVKLTAAEQGEASELSVPEDTQQSMGEVLSDF